MSRHRARSRLVPCRSRGYQASGTASVRPSSSCTVSSSFVTVTSTARAATRSLGEEGIPASHQHLLVLLDQALSSTNLDRPEAAAAFEANRVEPELRGVLGALDVNVRRFICVARVEVEAIRP